MAPARMLLSRNSLPSVGSIVSLDSSSTGNGSEPNLRTLTSCVGLLLGEAADRALVRDLDRAAGDRALDDRRRDHDRVEDDRELLVDVVGGEGRRTAARPRSLRSKLTARPPCWSGPERRRLELVAREQDAERRHDGGVAADRGRRQVEGLALGDLGRGRDRDEVEAAGLADERADRGGVGDARQLDDDPVRPARDDDRLGDAGRVHPVLDDLADDLDVGEGRRLAPGRIDPVLDLQAALEVEAELRLDEAAATLGIERRAGGAGARSRRRGRGRR